MSRRSLISPEENLIRSQRRGVPNVRMWSEQETPPQVAWDGYEEEPGFAQALPDQMVRLYWGSGFNPNPAVPITLQAGDSAAVVCHAAASDGWTIPEGWTALERYTSPAGYRYCVASIANARAGTHVFTNNVIANPSTWANLVAGYALRNSDGSPVGGRWSHIHGPERHDRRTFSFQTPDPGWDIAWQESSCTGVYAFGLEDVPYTPPGLLGFHGGMHASSVLCSFEFPRDGSPVDQFDKDSWFQPPKTSDTYGPGSNLYAFDNLGAYGPASSVAWALGWNL